MSKSWWKEKSKEELDDIRRRRSESLSRYWATMSAQEHLDITNKISRGVIKQYEGLSEEDKFMIGRKKSAGQIRRWELASDADKEKFGLMTSEINRLRWSRATREDRLEHGRKVSKGQCSLNLSEGQRTKWKNLSKEAYRSVCDEMSKGRKRYFLRMTPKEREEYGKIHAEARMRYFRNMTVEERKEWSRKRQLKPTMPEEIVGRYLKEKFPGQYGYNGNFSLGIAIGGRIPDFPNINGKKEVVEVFGGLGFFHFLGDEEEVKTHYAKYGYKCTVVWEWDCYKPGELDKIFNIGG